MPDEGSHEETMFPKLIFLSLSHLLIHKYNTKDITPASKPFFFVEYSVFKKYLTEIVHTTWMSHVYGLLQSIVDLV